MKWLYVIYSPLLKGYVRVCKTVCVCVCNVYVLCVRASAPVFLFKYVRFVQACVCTDTCYVCFTVGPLFTGQPL